MSKDTPNHHFAQRAIPIAMQFNCDGKIVHMQPTQDMLKLEFFQYTKGETELFSRTAYGELDISKVLMERSLEVIGLKVSKLMLPRVSPIEWFESDLVSIGKIVKEFANLLPSVNPMVK